MSRVQRERRKAAVKENHGARVELQLFMMDQRFGGECAYQWGWTPYLSRPMSRSMPRRLGRRSL